MHLLLDKIKVFDVDLRWLADGFKVSEYARTHDIDKVLFVCDETVYLDSRYCVEE